MIQLQSNLGRFLSGFGEKCEKTLLVVVVGWPTSKPEIGSLDVMTRSNQFVEGQNNIFSGGKPAKLPSCITQTLEILSEQWQKS